MLKIFLSLRYFSFFVSKALDYKITFIAYLDRYITVNSYNEFLIVLVTTLQVAHIEVLDFFVNMNFKKKLVCSDLFYSLKIVNY